MCIRDRAGVAGAGGQSVDADSRQEQQDDADGDEGGESAAGSGVSGCRAHAWQVRPSARARSEGTQVWPGLGGIPRGAEFVGEA